MPLDDTTWRWAPTVAPAGNNPVEVAPAAIIEVTPALNAHAPWNKRSAGERPLDRAGAPAGAGGERPHSAGGQYPGRSASGIPLPPAGNIEVAPAPDGAPASNASRADEEQLDRPAASETDPTDATALLIRARSFVERGWCRDANARDAEGYRVDPRSDEAVAWCMYGALEAVGVFDGDGGMPPAGRRLHVAINGVVFCLFNDTQETVEPVLAAFDRAIAAGGQ